MILYEPSTFTFYDLLGNEAKISNGSVTVDNLVLDLPFKHIEPSYRKESLDLLINTLEQVLKPNTEIPMTVIGLEWFKILMTNSSLGTLPPNTVTGINDRGIFVQVSKSTIPNELYVWSNDDNTFIPVKGEEYDVSNYRRTNEGIHT